MAKRKAKASVTADVGGEGTGDLAPTAHAATPDETPAPPPPASAAAPAPTPIWLARSYDPDAPSEPHAPDTPDEPDEADLLDEFEAAMAALRDRSGAADTPDEPEALTGAALREVVERDLRTGGSLAQSLPGYEERPAQITMALRVADALSTGKHAVVEASTGTGKALDVDTPIPTPTGWKRMGDLVVGDMVFDEIGQPTSVVAAFGVMQDRPCYEVVFSDGSTIVADAEHEWVSYTAVDRAWLMRGRKPLDKNFVTSEAIANLEELIAASSDSTTISRSEAVTLIGGHQWSVRRATLSMPLATSAQTPAVYPQRTLLTIVQSNLTNDLAQQRRDARTYSLVTTEQMAATLTVDTSPRANHAVAIAEPLSLPEVDLPISPYFLGAWLGDGSSRGNHITTADPDMIDEIAKDGYTVRRLDSHPLLYAVDDENGKAKSRWQPGMTGRLRALGLILNKHIPAIYLRASEQQRRALLAGLLDTDGTVNRSGAIEFTTTSERLADGVNELSCSLGFRPSVRRGRATLYGKDCGPKWTIAFTTDQQVFRLARKIAAQKERLRNFTPERNRFRYVVAVRPTAPRPVRCIQVASPSHLYLAGRTMIPTHNSIAYLLPIVRSGKVALISTANKALQEQLFYKDIPFVQRYIQPFEAALVKGMGNYLCLDRLHEERGSLSPTPSAALDAMQSLLGDPHAWDGDLDLLPQSLPGDLRARVAADNEQCAWRDCSFYGDCYVRQMREHARQAQVIVVNHTLLLIDAAMGGFLLPERDVIVIDEAHHLEEEATRAFTATVSPSRVQSLLALRRLREFADAQALADAGAANLALWDALLRVAAPNARGRQNLRQPLEEGLRLAVTIDALATSLQRMRPLLMPDRDEQLYEKMVKRTRTLASDLRIVFGVAKPDERVYYVEYTRAVGRRPPQPSVSAAPLAVTELLREKLFDRINTVATSATLAIGDDFSFFRTRVGLTDADEITLPLTFDYAQQALLYLPRMRLEPAFGDASGPYLEELAEQMLALVTASRGRAFLLFSSQNALQGVYQRLEMTLYEQGCSLLVQGRDVGRVELLRQFREQPRAVLFGLKSFWEGVDVAGEALSLVVIDKLPFDPPDDPVHEARVNKMRAAGENWFGKYVLPQAILRLKQGIGRLLRTRDDRGVMAILDKRLYTKGYGRQIVAAMPPARRTNDLADVQAFFAEDEDGAAPLT